jgi:hypothetical protein
MQGITGSIIPALQLRELTRSPANGAFRLRQGGKFHSFSQKFCTLCKIFVKKWIMYHAAAGEAGFHLGKCPVCVSTA